MGFSSKCYDLSESSRFQNAILALIVLNAVTIGMETFSFSKSTTTILEALDSVILWVFIIELIIRLIGGGLGFFKDSWNNLFSVPFPPQLAR